MSTENAENTEGKPQGPTQEQLEQALRKELIKQQDLLYAIVGGLASAIVGSFIWAVITVSTGYQIGYMAIGVGLLVGFGVRFFGAGIDRYFGYVGAVFALLGCLLGNLLSQIGFIAHEQSMPYFDVLRYMNLDVILSLYKETFSPMDIVFYALAGYEGYRFGFRNISDELVAAVAVGKVNPPPFASMRLPVVIVVFVAIAVGVYVVAEGTEGMSTFNYESGSKRAMGAMSQGRENGPWQMWWENGNLQAVGVFNNGDPDSVWTYYDENGVLTRTGGFADGMEEGEWIYYNSDGSVAGKGQYHYGRMIGPWEYYYTDGSVSEKGSFVLDRQDGEWESYFEDGKLASKGVYEMGLFKGLWTRWYDNGNKSEEIEYVPSLVNPETVRGKVLNSWEYDGKQRVVNGKGEVKLYDVEGNVRETGLMKDGFRDGVWKKFYEDGKKQEEGEYRDGIYYVVSAWAKNGDVLVSNGAGPMETLHPDGALNEFGKVKDGLRTENWISMYPDGKTKASEATYVDGKLTGDYTTYSMGGWIDLKGTYAANVRVGEWTWYSDDGVVETTATYIGGKKQGDQRFYNSYGELLKTEIYTDGKLVESILN